LQRHTRLFERGILDSFDFMVLIAFLDERFGVSLDLTTGGFDTVDDIARLVLACRRVGEAS
jgi:acyl carrier protein